ncbi:MAG: hypothetical protein LBR69_03275 [Endomicrobium sp.]|nr:hypothetical protein [Endomicrobium sp.]
MPLEIALIIETPFPLAVNVTVLPDVELNSPRAESRELTLQETGKSSSSFFAFLTIAVRVILEPIGKLGTTEGSIFTIAPLFVNLDFLSKAQENKTKAHIRRRGDKNKILFMANSV